MAEKSSPTTRRSFQSARHATTIPTTTRVAIAVRFADSTIAPTFP